MKCAPWLYGFAALLNLLGFVVDGFDFDKLIIAGLFVACIFYDSACRNYRSMR